MGPARRFLADNWPWIVLPLLIVVAAVAWIAFQAGDSGMLEGQAFRYDLK